jgi:hypothetical protein
MLPLSSDSGQYLVLVELDIVAPASVLLRSQARKPICMSPPLSACAEDLCLDERSSSCTRVSSRINDACTAAPADVFEPTVCCI